MSISEGSVYTGRIGPESFEADDSDPLDRSPHSINGLVFDALGLKTRGELRKVRSEPVPWGEWDNLPREEKVARTALHVLDYMGSGDIHFASDGSTLFRTYTFGSGIDRDALRQFDIVAVGPGDKPSRPETWILVPHYSYQEESANWASEQDYIDFLVDQGEELTDDDDIAEFIFEQYEAIDTQYY